jgi:exopolysaccharide biosynthesis polyprenyl glycosylphosphotransferase
MRLLHSATQRKIIILLCLLTDALLLWISLSLASLSRADTLIYLDGMQQLYVEQLLVLASYLAAFVYLGAYQPSRMADSFDTLYYVCLSLFGLALLHVTAASLLPRDALAISRRELLLAPVLGAVLLCAWRFIFSRVATRFESFHRTFYIFGASEDSIRLREEMLRNEPYRSEVNCVDLAAARALVARAEAEGAPQPFIDRDAIILSARTPEGMEETAEALEFCETHFDRVYLYPSLHDLLLFRHSDLKSVSGVPLVELTNRHAWQPYHQLKRVVDIAAALTGIVLAAPLFVGTALAVKLTSPGPIFYRQERMGRNGRRFELVKFRSMVQDAEAKTGPMWATQNDARVTPVGRFIRKHRIDELPQLFNVLRGDMSLIGPRPERPHFHEQFRRKWPLFDRRLEVRPGVTSLSHVLGSYDSKPEDRLRYDLMYISSLSPLTDLRIALATVRVVLGAKGAQ